MTPIPTNREFQIGVFAAFYDEATGPIAVYLPQDWTRVIVDASFGRLVAQESSESGGFVLVSNLQGTEVRATLAEDCAAWDVIGAAPATVPAGTVVRCPNGPVPCRAARTFDGAVSYPR